MRYKPPPPRVMVQIGARAPQPCELEERLPTECVRVQGPYDLIIPRPAEWTIYTSVCGLRLNDDVPVAVTRAAGPPRFGMARVVSIYGGTLELAGLGALAAGRGYLDNLQNGGLSHAADPH